MTLTLDFQGKILKLLYLRDGQVNSLWIEGMWVGCDVGCTVGLTLGHGAWKIDRPSNGSIWDSYSFQLVGPWMGYSFTELGAEGCCLSSTEHCTLDMADVGSLPKSNIHQLTNIWQTRSSIPVMVSRSSSKLGYMQRCRSYLLRTLLVDRERTPQPLARGVKFSAPIGRRCQCHIACSAGDSAPTLVLEEGKNINSFAVSLQFAASWE